MANTNVLLASNTVGSGGAATVTFSSIPATYTDLFVKMSVRGTGSNTTFRVYLNGDTTGANYSQYQLYGYATTTGATGGNPGDIGYFPDSTYGVSMFGSSDFYLPNYASANHKRFSVDNVAESNSATVNVLSTNANLWASTAAVNSIQFYFFSGDIAEYSTFYLYGIKNS